jgi:hypothetical protein
MTGNGEKLEKSFVKTVIKQFMSLQKPLGSVMEFDGDLNGKFEHLSHCTHSHIPVDHSVCDFLFSFYFTSIKPYWLLKPTDTEHVTAPWLSFPILPTRRT